VEPPNQLVVVFIIMCLDKLFANILICTYLWTVDRITITRIMVLMRSL
jgi:hypothetical protein